MSKAYVDTGGMTPIVKELVDTGLLTTCYYPFEQRNRKVRNFDPGSGATWMQANLSWDEDVGSWQDDEPSAKFKEIRALVQMRVDCQHLDSAHKAGCDLFLTSDKTDIWSNRKEIEALLGLKVLHMPSEAELLKEICGV